MGGLLTCAEQLVRHGQENTARLTPAVSDKPAPAAPASALADILKGATPPPAQ
jgi:hypothetical protein